MLKQTKSPGSYGCQREVYHPLSPNAEPTALLFYDSGDDSDTEKEENGASKGSSVRARQMLHVGKEQGLCAWSDLWDVY